MEVLQRLPETARIGVGVVNQKVAETEAIEEVVAKVGHAIDLFGRERVLLHPDCGFATFADNPICSHQNAQQKLAVIARAAERFAA